MELNCTQNKPSIAKLTDHAQLNAKIA